MSPYILVIIWMGILLFVSSNYAEAVCGREVVLGREVVRVNHRFALISVLPLIYWTATRSRYFADTRNYARSFEEMPRAISQMGSYLSAVSRDKGFYVLGLIIKWVIGNRTALYFGIIAAIQIIAIAMVFRSYSEGFLVSLFVFVASTDYVSWMHNGIRQFTAAVIVFAGSGLLFRKKYVPLIALILLAATFHLSALFMLPVIFLVRGRPWKLRTILLFFAVMVAIFYISRVTGWLDDKLAGTQYENVITEWENSDDEGTNPIRVLVYSVPTILSLVGLRFIREEDDPVINVACNMSIISSLLYLISAVTSGIYLGRLPIYCSLYATGILLPWEIRHMFSEKTEQVVRLMMVIGFLGFYYYQMHVTWGVF